MLIDAGNPSRDAIEELALASAASQRPVAMFVDESDGALTKAAIEAGVSAYVVAGLSANRIRPVLDAAIARLHMMQKMRVELAETRRALEECKLIDREKGITEDEADALLRKAAMDQGRRLGDVAQALVTAAHMLAPVPVALALGLGGPARFEVLSVLNLNGNAMGVSAALAGRMPGHDFALTDARGAGNALLDAAGDRLRSAVPFAFSMHTELVRYWLEGLGRPLPASLQICPPSAPMGQSGVIA